MESKTNFRMVGLAVLILATGLLISGIWLSVGFSQKKYHIYTVYMHEAAAGLNEESLVKYNGVKVGIVSTIELNQRDPRHVKLLLKIQDGTPITTSTQATLITQGITGATYLGLSATTASLTPLQKIPGEPYPIIPYKKSFFSQLEENINTLSVGVKQIVTKENTQHLKKTLANLQSITDVIAENNKNLDKSLRDLPALVTELKHSVRQFNVMALDVSTAGKQVSSTMKAGRNSIDKLSQQAIPPAVLLLHRLDSIAANLEKMSAEMRRNPSIIIRGNTPPKPGPGE